MSKAEDAGRASTLRTLLIEWRSAAALSQRQAAASFGVAPGTWASWETGAVPSPAMIDPLARFLRVEPTDLRRAAGPDRVRRPQTSGGVGTTPLAAARIARGWPQTRVAEALSISVPTLSRWEAGEYSPHPDDLARIARVFDTPVSEVGSWLVGCRPRRSTGVGRLPSLRDAWRRRGLSESDVVRALGVDAERVRRWGTGRVGVPHRVWLDLCHLLDLDPERDRAALRAAPSVPEPQSALAHRRAEAGLTQRALGDLIGVSGSAIGSWESGRRQLPVLAARRLADVLRCDPASLLGDSAPPRLADDEVRGLLLSEPGLALQRTREAQGLSRAQLARAVGVSPDTVRRWEAGSSTPRAVPAARLEVVLGLPRGCLRPPLDQAG